MIYFQIQSVAHIVNTITEKDLRLKSVKKRV